MYSYAAQQSFDLARFADRDGIIAAGVYTIEDGWRWSGPGNLGSVVAGIVERLPALRLTGATVLVDGATIVIDSASHHGTVEYAVVIHEPSHEVRKSLRRMFRRAWGLLWNAKPPKPVEPRRKPARPRKPRAEAATKPEPVPEPKPSEPELAEAEALLAEAEVCSFPIRVTWHPEARTVSGLAGSLGWRVAEGIPCRSATPGRWYLQHQDRTSVSFHVGEPRPGEPSICRAEPASTHRPREAPARAAG